MKNILLIAQIVISVVITASILLQAQGTGLGSTWGGGGETYHTRRGLEKVLFYFTIVSIVIFAGLSLAIIII
ncbi:MAG: preprotein translocase subunit SecG [Candidatus Pacebacteria bacterium]|jgi:protein translocase SecG subunit|nr:preprotein translocase subunit SecG [Candidatus Paceibacterota bacterium]MBT3511897.1 preprotein translocase subunit SecG [Candidatus Paceibacterota bacterium]MBT4004586.1 preprotein translocase subunit SecG [Candidatus Paceibacterota bacterium]MBT4359166.1 preprotein translocase subunit SecG [Candidatus Paceibacterota bacterium]MBT4680773.1 preprotein translocase subunit SecG [Candidatus Paceibacterota bacterium]